MFKRKSVKGNRNSGLGKGILLVVFISMLGIGMMHLLEWQVRSRFSAFVGYLVTEHPDLEHEIMVALKEASAKDQVKGEQILSRYGHKKSSLTPAYKILVTISFIGMAAVNLLWLGWIRYCIHQKYAKKVNSLTSYLEKVNKGESPMIPCVTKVDETAFLEDEIYKTVTMLKVTKEQAIRDKQVLKENLSDVAHQLKTPLTAMGMMIEILKEITSEEVQLYVEQLERQLHRTGELVHALLTLSKLEVDAIKFEEEHVSCYILLLRVIEIIEPLSRQKGQQLLMEPTNPTDDEVAIGFVGDMSWSIEAVINIVKNCIEHTPENGWIQITYKDNPLYVSLVIQDSGEGFAKEDLPYLFKRFYRGKNNTKDSVGIGLSLSKLIFEKQGGLVCAENVKEGGARFEIKFYKYL